MRKRTMRLLILALLCPLFLFAATDQSESQATHLKGINFLYMQIDVSMAKDITQNQKLDLNDIVELQLRRGDIALRTYIANEPALNVPIIELLIDTASPMGSDEFELVLRIRDHVTIDRNNEKTVATIFEMRRIGRRTSKDLDAVKSELRELMSDFVSIFRQQNILP